MKKSTPENFLGQALARNIPPIDVQPDPEPLSPDQSRSLDSILKLFALSDTRERNDSDKNK